jgi:glycosidase
MRTNALRQFLAPLQRLCVVLLCGFSSLFAQSPASLQPLERVDPPFWWVGMKTSQVELLMYGKNIGASAPTLESYKGVSIAKVEKTQNPNYLYVTLSIQPSAKPGILNIALKNGTNAIAHKYELRQRIRDAKRHQGFSSADAVYMFMPDRFSNGDPTNDNLPNFPDKMHRDSLNYRHGGDIQGMINHLDYIKNLGMTAIWSTPLIENNMLAYSYHGYAFTDFYAVDRRFGTNNDYRRYVDSCHAHGLKVILDVVLNHMGDQNFLALDPPSPKWINDNELLNSTNRRKDIIKPNFRASTQSDPYASEYDKRGMSERWFDWMMPDLDAREPHLATYLIQNTIWWVEFSGLDGLRVDTYPYPNKDFTAKWTKAVLNEYPTIGMVGEVWIGESVGMCSYWQANARNKDGFNSNLPSLTDFPLNTALNNAFNEKEEWAKGMVQIYNTLAQDFFYPDPMKNLVFLDNHDLSRYFSVVQEDVKKFKMALALLFTVRGTPQVYYGTELAVAGWKDPDPLVRKDFPGGWKEDTVNAFTEKGRTAVQNDMFNYLRTLAQWRKTKSVIHTGKFMQFVPFEGIYAYFRYNASETVMVAFNNNDTEKTFPTARFSERLGGFTKAKNVVSGEVLSSLSSITIPAKSAFVLELQK